MTKPQDNSPPGDVWLFSYGTLQQLDVQLATFGRALEGAPDVLPGYATTMLEITDPDVIATSGTTHHPIVAASPGAEGVGGTVFRITREELARADAYEVSDYARIAVRLQSGRDAFVYVRAD